MSILTQIGIALGALIILILVGIGGWMYIGHLKSEISSLQGANEVAARVTAENAVTDKKILDDAKRQGDILMKERNDALAQTKLLEKRYQQIMETPHDQDAVISPVLCNSLIRLYELPASNGSSLPVQPSKGSPTASRLAQPSCGKLTQKDVSAWLEIEVYPAFKLMQQNFIDLNKYVGDQAQ